MFRTLSFAILAGAAILLAPISARAVLTPQSDAMRVAGTELLQTRQYRLLERLPGSQESIQQSIIVWEVTGGTWDGQSLQGLSLVVVSQIAENNSRTPMTSCYVSHMASAAQREALVSAFVASQHSPGDAASWRLESAVIRVEHVGGTVIVHLGRVA